MGRARRKKKEINQFSRNYQWMLSAALFRGHHRSSLSNLYKTCTDFKIYSPINNHFEKLYSYQSLNIYIYILLLLFTISFTMFYSIQCWQNILLLPKCYLQYAVVISVILIICFYLVVLELSNFQIHHICHLDVYMFR